MTAEPTKLGDETVEVVPAELNWAAEIIGTSARGHVVKIQVTFEEEPNSDREMRMRAMVQSIMRQTHSTWIDSLGAIKYRKWSLK